MNVVDDKQTGRQKDGQAGDVRKVFVLLRYRLDKSKRSRISESNEAQDGIEELPAQSEEQNQLRDDHRGPLEVDCLP